MHRLTRAALLGLVAGLAIASLMLATTAIMRSSETCAVPDSEECAFQEQVDQRLARTQFLASIGCACMALGIALLTKKTNKAS
jgi:hypothetical protein